MSNKLAEALGIRFCKTCGEEITDVDIYYRTIKPQFILHDSEGYFTWANSQHEEAHYTGHKWNG